jgi:hypothetical protein
MSDLIESQESTELLTELSEQEQEIAAGGFGMGGFGMMFFDQQEIFSSASNQFSGSYQTDVGNVNLNSSSNSTYYAKRTTFAAIFPMFGSGGSWFRQLMGLRSFF